MTDERLKKLAYQLLGMFKNLENRWEILNKLKSVASNQQIYFSNFSPEEFLKLYFFIISLKETGNFDMASKIFEKVFFAYLFSPTGEDFIEECEVCDGGGRIDCDECDGSGRKDCNECDGNGEVTCDECGGEGEVEGLEGPEECDFCDEGNVTCDECEGDGYISCDYCDGGRKDCTECDGEGEFIGLDSSIEITLICSWDTNFKNLCELNAGTPKPVIKKQTLEKNPEILELNIKEWGDLHIEFIDGVDEDNFYCWGMADESSLVLTRKFEITDKKFESPPNKDEIFRNFLE
jgi:hypothetical protein